MVARSNSLRSRLPACLVGLACAAVAGEVWGRVVRTEELPAGWVRPELVKLGWSSDEFRSFDTLPSEVERQPGSFRLLALGDSFMSAGGIYRHHNRDVRWPHRFETYLEPRQSERLETRILATKGWGTQQQLLAFLQRGACWQPDLVVLCVCTNNDLLDITAAIDARRARRPYFVASDGKLLGFAPDGQRLLLSGDRPERGPSAFIDLLQARRWRSGRLADWRLSTVDPRYTSWSGDLGEDAVAGLLLPDRVAHEPQFSHDMLNAYIVESNEWLDYEWELERLLIAELKRAVERAGAELVVLPLPMSLDPTDPTRLTGSGLVHTMETPAGPITIDLDNPRRRLAAICEDLDLECWDIIDDFHAVASAPQAYASIFPDANRHWSRAGHGLVASLLAPRIAARIDAAGGE
ncbi:SGNH/GDSL hydrolase family protein [Engelhardtia mirabilis]|uniref:SGNH hydrolase-type esterase domain-containing protein n=1 Tax=Engelhardtia mirabilis TaxID=2528011 RepID=A0A518BFU2_9BACT|nr:hypothetical protein Pla133_08490 [Planctomycetes bacterium Pla133]QDV00109.1 hypothetical protein Pla86_08480 [Planctomycetes bacterium Pla86]